MIRTRRKMVVCALLFFPLLRVALSMDFDLAAWLLFGVPSDDLPGSAGDTLSGLLQQAHEGLVSAWHVVVVAVTAVGHPSALVAAWTGAPLPAANPVGIAWAALALLLPLVRPALWANGFPSTPLWANGFPSTSLWANGFRSTSPGMSCIVSKAAPAMPRRFRDLAPSACVAAVLSWAFSFPGKAGPAEVGAALAFPVALLGLRSMYRLTLGLLGRFPTALPAPALGGSTRRRIAAVALVGAVPIVSTIRDICLAF